jgi:muramidase (phage lysozyme)
MSDSYLLPEQKSLERMEFEYFMRTGRVLTNISEFKFGGNPYHDELGKFTTSGRAVAPKLDPLHAASQPAIRPASSTPSNSTPRPLLYQKRVRVLELYPDAKERARRQAQMQNLQMAVVHHADKRINTFVDLTSSLESRGRYDVIVGGRAIVDYSRHPNINVRGSTAAGAFQITHPTWTETSNALGLTDFSPQSQRLAATHLMRKLGVVAKLQAGDVEGAIYAAGRRWQVFPLDSSGRRIGDGKVYSRAYVDALIARYREMNPPSPN